MKFRDDKIKFLTILGILLLLISACLEMMPLPSDINAPPDFSAGDTTYLLQNPIWDESWGFQSPIEMSIALDGHIFIADSAAHKIFVLEQDGTILEEFDALSNLFDKDGNTISPIDVDIDGKMNVFFIDGSRKVFRWNQLWNSLGILSVADSATFINNTSEEIVTVSSGSYEWQQIANSSEWRLDNVFWSSDESTIDSLLVPHLFFDASTPENDYADFYYASPLSKYSGLSAAKGEDSFIYLTDSYFNRLVRVNFLRAHLIKLGSDNVIWTHKGVFGHTVADSGTGAGTLNDPVGVDVDFAGNVYYAQTGNWFSIHKIIPSSSPASSSSSVFQPGENDIMDLFRFSNPLDIAVDQKQFIYVANTDAKEIQVFDSDGKFFKKAGITTMTVDTTLLIINGTDTVAVDTFLTIEIKGFLSSPRSITVDDRDVIYICDTPNSRIVRYRLSNTLDENVTEEK